jgi:hypothetical protein
LGINAIIWVNYKKVYYNRVLSSIYPCELVGEELAFPKFPEFLGKFSSKRKISREILEIKKAIAKATYNGISTILIISKKLLHTRLNLNMDQLCLST